jgi:hypothetical protein
VKVVEKEVGVLGEVEYQAIIGKIMKSCFLTVYLLRGAAINQSVENKTS